MFVSVLGEADPDLRFQIYDVTQFNIQMIWMIVIH